MADVIYLKSRSNLKLKEKPVEDPLDKIERQHAELEAACDIVDSQLLSLESSKHSLKYMDYLLLTVSMLLIYVLPIYLGIPVMLVTMYLLNK